MVTVNPSPIRFVLTGQFVPTGQGQDFKVSQHRRIRHFDLVGDQGRLSPLWPWATQA